jgi:2-polyprenyl-3-methyl-5-hydroxy-6-metoxy-1,4-benzoquinol methylase
MVASAMPGTAVVASDMNVKYPAIFKELAQQRIDKEPVHFHLHDARTPASNFPNSTFDIITCISVLEHTDRYDKIAEDIHRQLRPGGLFVVTFDIGRGPEYEVPPSQAAALLAILTSLFVEVNPPTPTAIKDYSSDAIAARANGMQERILDTHFMREFMPEVAPPSDWALTISCHVFRKL